VALGIGAAGAVLVGLTDFIGAGVSTVGVPLVALSWGFGRVAHSRGRLAAELRVRNAELQSTRDERARLEVATDRARLSGELDELLHHRLRDLAAMADRGAASVAAGSAGPLLVDIERESRSTLDEMRSLVGVLRSDAEPAEVAPQPSLTSLDALLIRTRGTGARLSYDGDARVLPAGVELTAYRVVEQLLEALDDAPGVQVHVHFSADELELTVEGPARRRGDVSAALARARERVELHRGSLRTTTRADGPRRSPRCRCTQRPEMRGRDELLATGAGTAGALAAAVSGAGVASCLAAVSLGGAFVLHRRRPRTGAALLLAGVALTVLGGRLEILALALGLNAFAIGRYATGTVRAAGGAAIVGTALGLSTADEVVFGLFATIAPLLGGWALADRDAVAEQLAARGDELEAERDAFAELSVRHERARIAAELHDIVAHAISVMVVQASAGQRLAAVDAEATQDAFAAIAAAARHAEADMGRLVTLLTDTGDGAATTDLVPVRELVDGATGAGLNVALRLDGDLADVGERLARGVHLVVREGLTNALRYASGARVEVHVDGGRDALVVEVRNGPAPGATLLAGTGTGNGLRGLREQLDVAGGRLDARPTGDGGWLLRARLPRRATVATPAA
jgi:signal transduction histidine kinase